MRAHTYTTYTYIVMRNIGDLVTRDIVIRYSFYLIFYIITFRNQKFSMFIEWAFLTGLFTLKNITGKIEKLPHQRTN